jgi:hypothetical protein
MVSRRNPSAFWLRGSSIGGAVLKINNRSMSRLRKSVVGDLASDAPDPWRERARCRGLPPAMFVQVDHESHPQIPHHERVKLTNAFFAEAIQHCEFCPVRKECEDDATDDDRRRTVRGGLRPWDRHWEGESGTYHSKPLSGRTVGRPAKVKALVVAPAPKEIDPKVANRLICEGYENDEARAAFGVGLRTWEQYRRDFLYRHTSSPPDCVINFQVRSYRSRKGSALNGAAWLLGISECGKVALVATRREGRVRTHFLGSAKVELSRTDVTILSRFPRDLIAGE